MAVERQSIKELPLGNYIKQKYMFIREGKKQEFAFVFFLNINMASTRSIILYL